MTIQESSQKPLGPFERFILGTVAWLRKYQIESGRETLSFLTSGHMGVISGQSAHLAFTRVFASLLCSIQPEQAKGETVQVVQKPQGCHAAQHVHYESL